MGDVPGPASSKRQRSRQACDSCRSRKRKCDGYEPCSQCVVFEYVCKYEDKATAATPAKLRRLTPKTQESESPDQMSPPGQSHTDDTTSTHPGPSTPFADGFSDSIRSKFATVESAVAFPRLLGNELSEGQAPRLHCFGWNTGSRREVPKPIVDVTLFLSLAEAKAFSSIYFNVVHPEIGFLNQDAYNRKLESRWSGELTTRDFDCVIAGVTSLGCFFAGSDANRHESELQNLLDEVLHIYCGIYFPKIDYIAGYILRTIYLRLTTRPYASWAASCAMMHAIESAGLYIDPQLPPFSQNPNLHDSEIEARRRLFWTAWSLHAILCIEYGRTRIELKISTRQPIMSTHVSPTFLLIAYCLETKDGSGSHADKETKLTTMLEQLCNLNVHTEFMQLLKADMIFSVYRRLRLLRHAILKTLEAKILEAARLALESAKKLANNRIPWWNTVTFQHVCVCLAIDSSDSLALLPHATTTLKHVASVFDTFMTREALQVANTLVRLARDKKTKDLRRIESAFFQDVDAPGAEIAKDVNPILEVSDDPILWDWLNDSWEMAMLTDKEINGVEATGS